MARTSNKKILEDLKEIRFYQWQFLRRNKKYQCEYDKLCKLTKKKCFDRSTPYEILNTKAGQLQIAFEDRWKMTYPAYYEDKKPDPLPTILESTYYPVFAGSNPQFDQTKNNRGEVIKVPRIITLSINLDYSPGKIKTVFNERINKELKNRRAKLKEIGKKSEARQAQIKPINKKNRNLYDEYLKIWDFVNGPIAKGRNLAWCKKRLHPKDNVTEHNFRTKYRTAKQLIDGGYVHIK